MGKSKFARLGPFKATNHPIYPFTGRGSIDVRGMNRPQRPRGPAGRPSASRNAANVNGQGRPAPGRKRSTTKAAKRRNTTRNTTRPSATERALKLPCSKRKSKRIDDHRSEASLVLLSVPTFFAAPKASECASKNPLTLSGHFEQVGIDDKSDSVLSSANHRAHAGQSAESEQNHAARLGHQIDMRRSIAGHPSGSAI